MASSGMDGFNVQNAFRLLVTPKIASVPLLRERSIICMSMLFVYIRYQPFTSI